MVGGGRDLQSAGIREVRRQSEEGSIRSARWTNGAVEEFIHKLKPVKRQGYGRENIDLLKARVMAA